MSNRILSIPILYKVLIANGTIVLLGAIAGTWVAISVSQEDDLVSKGTVMFLLGAMGVFLSIVANYLVLRAAFRPLDDLEDVTNAVRNGDLTARATQTSFSDPQMARLAETFNLTLDELERDRAQLRDLASQVIRAQVDERKRIARELHDDTAQVLFAQLLRVTAMKSSPLEDVRSTAETLENMTVEAIEGVRRLALELRPPALDDLGLREALGDLAQRFSEQLLIPVEYHVTGLRDRLPGEVELVLYRVAQEAMTNVAKHADARHAWISLIRSTTGVTLSIDDDGKGFDVEIPVRGDGRGLGLGVFGMEERVALVGGALMIRLLNPRGVRIVASIPLSGRIAPTPVKDSPNATPIVVA
ncbi:MAG: HAMP domain-containing sensor histidine kinase [Thermomicrobiales bacterium]